LSKRSAVDWLHVLGNIGIVAGLVLVSIQIRDSNRIASAEMFSASVDTVVSINIEQLGDIPYQSMTRVLYEPNAATVEDLYIADRIYDALFRALVRVHVLDQLDLYGGGEIDPNGFVHSHYQAFACPYGLAWLDRALDGLEEAGGSDQRLFGSLTMIRKLAEANPAKAALTDRQARTTEIISKLKSLNE